MCKSYKYASDAVYEWYLLSVDNGKLFPNKSLPEFPFNLDGGCKVSSLGNKGTYLETH